MWLRSERRLPKPPICRAPPVLRADRGPETSPPRYTEATLVKAMEEKKIGRPSTHAPTPGTIQTAGCVDGGLPPKPGWPRRDPTARGTLPTQLVDYDSSPLR